MTQTALQEAALVASATLDAPVVHHSRLLPAGAEDVSWANLVKELVRWPTLLCVPFGVAILVVVGMASPIAAVPVALVLSTAAVFDATRRAARRTVARNTTAVVTSLPKPRSAS